MKFKNISIRNAAVWFAFLTIALTYSCKKYVEIPVAPGLLSTEKAYASDSSATSVVLSLYNGNPTTKSIQYITWLSGLQADELQYTGSDPLFIQFAQNQVLKDNGYADNYLWGYPYQVIRYANLAIYQLSIAKNVSQAAKNQLTGEAKFMRAFMFFYLVNLDGDVPLSLDPNALNNGSLPRAKTAQVYAQIIADLTSAQSLLTESYPGNAIHRSRVNKWAAAALLARVYLYTADYKDAQAEASLVINSGAYSMPDLADAFINSSPEVILQFATTYGVSSIGSKYRTDPATSTSRPPTYVLYNNFVNSFEPGDSRRTAWVDSTVSHNKTYYRLDKYKIADQNQGNNEYDIILRLAEQYLIRAEAEAEQNDLTDAAADLNIVRQRAGLGSTAASTQSDLLAAILRERKVELFGEFGHRWLDLKRTGQADAVLGPLKSTWTPTAVLDPIPYQEILLNKNLTQNPGY